MEYVEMSDDETPRRRTSRKAAEKSKKKLSKMITESNKHDKPDIDMEDSDIDESWKPSEAEKQTEKEEQDEKESNDTDCKELQVYTGSKRGRNSSTSRSKVSANGLVGSETKAVPDGKALSNGDFVMLLSDANKENVPIWRYDCHQMMQKYNCLQSQGGSYLHKAANMFNGYIESDRDRFISVPVKYVHADATSYTVKIIKKEEINSNGKTSPAAVVSIQPVSPVNSAARDQAIKETRKHQDAFEVYIQALMSHCLDANFLDEIIADNDTYFLESIEKIRVITKSKIDHAMSGAKWPEKFMKSITTSPKLILKDVGSKNTKCGTCDAKYTSLELKLPGQAYNMTNLKKETGDIGICTDYLVCSKCRVLIDIFHNLHHNKFLLYTTCDELITKRKEEEPNKESSEILKELLENSAWLEEQFNIFQGTWADAEMYVKP